MQNDRQEALMTKKPHRRTKLGPVLALLRSRIAAAEEGATAIEYALIASGVGMAVAGTVWSVGSALKTNFYDSLAAMF
jgi:Flp pilus assembly pilin Flp